MPIAITQNTLAKHIAKRRWIRRLKWFDLPKQASVAQGDLNFFVDLGDWRGPSYHVLNWGLESYEPRNREFLSACLAQVPRGVFFDIGANIGIFPFQLARQFPELTIHAFEPDQTTFDCLQKTFDQRAFAKVNVHKLALSDKKGEAVFYADGDNHGGHSLNARAIADEGNTIAHKVTIATDTLDDFVVSQGLKSVDVIKLDVQRHESEVLSQAHKTIARSRPIVLMECYFTELLAPNSLLLKPFLGQEYVIVDPITRRQYAIDAAASLAELKNIGREYCDLAFIPREKTSSLL